MRMGEEEGEEDKEGSARLVLLLNAVTTVDHRSPPQDGADAPDSQSSSLLRNPPTLWFG